MYKKPAQLEQKLPNRQLALSDRDREAFFKVLANPPKPNARLRRAFRKVEMRIVSDRPS